MKKTYTQMQIFVAGAGDDDHIKLITDTLDGQPNTVEIKVGENTDEKSLGFYNIDQLIDALNSIKHSNFEYLDVEK